MMLAPNPRRRSARRAAFTLLEVLVVVAILVILAGVGVVATTKYLDDAKKNKAQLGCKGLAEACEAYFLNPQSEGNYPESLQQLLLPFGGSGGVQSFLKNGQSDLIDPWGNQYQYQIRQKQDGSYSPFVHTIAPDQTQISQYGVGHLATPTN